MPTRLPAYAGSSTTLATLIISAMLAVGSSCVPPPAGTPTEGNVGVDPNAFPNLRVVGEPNDTFGNPIDVVFDGSGGAHLRGTLSTATDIDVYALGALAAGDRLLIDVSSVGSSTTLGSGLDSAIAIFDGAGQIAFENDDRSPELGQLDPFLSATIRHDSPVYFLAITNAPLGAGTAGTYDMTIMLSRNGAPAPANPQVVALDFDGGSITLPGEQVVTVGPFDTGNISSAYAGLTAVVRQKIAAVVRENYEGFGLNVLVIPGSPLPGGCTVSTILFGGTNPSSFGSSQQVDAYNGDPCDQSIIFTEMFTPSRFGRLLTADELGVAIGNVAAHEIGHLLGLNHVDDITDLMDTTGGPDTFLLDQEFKTAPLDFTIFPIGDQNGVQLLLETIGAGV